MPHDVAQVGFKGSLVQLIESLLAYQQADSVTTALWKICSKLLTKRRQRSDVVGGFAGGILPNHLTGAVAFNGVGRARTVTNAVGHS